MRRAVLTVALVVLVVLGQSPLGSTPVAALQVTGPRGTVTGAPAPAGTAVLRGTVVASDTGTPVRRALVRAMSADPPDNAVAATDDQGRFEIRELVGGRYSLTASKAGFVTLGYGQRRPNEGGTQVELAPGQVVEKLAIGLPRGGVVTGRVVDDAGEPLAEARVQVLRSQFMPGGRRMLPAGGGDTTDDQGAFRIYGLMPGDYVVSATVRNDTGVMTMPNQRLMSGVEQGFAPTYYPGTPSLSDAQRISVGAGQEVSGITFGMTPTRVARISGRVIGGTAGNADGSFVMLMPDEAMGMGGMLPGSMVQRDGTFVVNAVPPGRYTLRVQPRGSDPDGLAGSVSVVAAGLDLDNVVIALQKPGTLAGRIEFEGGPPAGLAAGEVHVRPMSLDPMSRSFFPIPPRTHDDFTFSIRGASGPTLIRVSGAPGWYVQSVEASGEDVTDTPITLAAGVDVQGVRILMTQTASSVSGVVRDDRGNAVLDATVIVFPADDTKWTFQSRFIKIARPDTAGRFELRGLPAYAGYRAIALQGLEGMQAYDPEFLSSVRDRAESLALAAGETKALDLRLRQ